MLVVRPCFNIITKVVNEDFFAPVYFYEDMIKVLDAIPEFRTIGTKEHASQSIVFNQESITLARMRNFHRLNLESPKHYRLAKFQFRYPCVLIYNLLTREYGQSVLLCLRDIL